ncbi:MAG TPA: helix-turn-helix transcriptional regulator [Desulfatiglandales bacterium]|nr:helix-turn-helix transcriptional regulator [Desulfatiglandales bacterium]
MTQLFERIKKIREDNNLSQDAFAKILGVHRGHISKIETGVANPSEPLLLTICFEFDISWNWLNEGKGHTEEYWGSEELTKLSKSGLFPHKQKSLFILYEVTLGLLESYQKIPECLGNDTFRLLNDNIKPGDPIIIEVVEDILKKLRQKGFKKMEVIKSLNDLNNEEESAIKILRGIDKNSLKDFYLFLASKANRLNKIQKERLKKEIAILKKASK